MQEQKLQQWESEITKTGFLVKVVEICGTIPDDDIIFNAFVIVFQHFCSGESVWLDGTKEAKEAFFNFDDAIAAAKEEYEALIEREKKCSISNRFNQQENTT